MAENGLAMSEEQMNLSSLEFWSLPKEARDRAYAHLRQNRPIAYFEEPDWMFTSDGRGFFAVTKYDDVFSISRNPTLFCSGRGAVSIPDLPPQFLEFFGSMINTDDPRHSHLRKLVLRAFTPRRIEILDQRIEELAESLISDIAKKEEVDFVAEAASILPLKIICEMMGVPSEYEKYVLDRSNIILGALDDEFLPVGKSVEESLIVAAVELTALMEEIGKDRIANPRDDITTSLVTASVDGEALSASELASFFILLVVAGNETTRNAIAWGMHALEQFKDQRQLWFSDFEANSVTGVDEIVRWSSPVIFMRRTATAATKVRGVDLVEGDKLLLMYGSANRDEERFSNPDNFDVTRKESRHLGFGGYGPHQCLGAHLARRELHAIFSEVARVMPDYEVVGEPSYLFSNFINGIKHLHVRPNAR